MEKIRIKYFSDKIEKLTYIGGKSDWIDLRASADVTLKAGRIQADPAWESPWSFPKVMKLT